MSGQMNLLSPSSEDSIEVPISPSVLYLGSRAHVHGRPDEALFPHRYVPPVPTKLPDEAAWLAALDFAEEQLRFKHAPCAILDFAQLSGTGCCGGRCGPSSPTLTSSSRGVEVDGVMATWAQLLRGRQEQREVEFDLARARDLAQAYHCLDYYGHVYGEPEDRDGFDGIGEQWSPVPLIRGLAEEAIDLGGNPTRMKFHTAYMRQGIAEATA